MNFKMRCATVCTIALLKQIKPYKAKLAVPPNAVGFLKNQLHNGINPNFKEKTMTQAMYQLHISTPSCMKATLPVSGEVANYLSTRLLNHG